MRIDNNRTDRNGIGGQKELTLWGEFDQVFTRIDLSIESFSNRIAEFPDTPLKQLLRFKILVSLGKTAGLSWASATTVKQLAGSNDYFKNIFAHHEDVPLYGYPSLTEQDLLRFSAWELEEAKLQCKAEYQFVPQSVRELLDDPAVLEKYAEQLAALSSRANCPRPEGFEAVYSDMQERFPDMDYSRFVEISAFMGYLDCSESGKLQYRMKFRREKDALTILAACTGNALFSKEAIPAKESIAKWMATNKNWTPMFFQKIIDVAECSVAVLAESLLLADPSDDTHPAADYLLLTVAEGHIRDEELCKRVLDRVFEHFIDKVSTQYFLTHVMDERFVFICNYVQEHFVASVLEKTPLFYYAAAATEIRRAQDSCEDIAETAMKAALSEDDVEACLAISVLGMLAYSKDFDFVKMPSFVMDDPVGERIVTHAFSPNSVLHRVCYAAVSDLIKEGYIRKSALAEPSVMLLAKRMLLSEHAERAIDVLSDCSIYQVLHPVPSENDEELKERFSRKYAEEASAVGRIRLFPTCMVLECWQPTKDDLGKAVKQLCADACRSKELLNRNMKRHLADLADEAAKAFELVADPDFVPKSAPAVVSSYLRSGDYIWVKNNYYDCARPQQVITSEKDLAVLIRYIDSLSCTLDGDVIPQRGEDEPCMLLIQGPVVFSCDSIDIKKETQRIVRGTEVKTRLSSPFIICRWFYLLCKYAEPEVLDRFTSEYLNVLQRPAYRPDGRMANVLMLGDAVENRLQVGLLTIAVFYTNIRMHSKCD